MPRISANTVDRIFETANVVEVIGEFLSLKKKGTNHWAKSPFANEKTPSFAVSASKNIWKDFSTGKGGNSIGYLMEAEGMTYPDALKWLADFYKIEIVYEDSGNDGAANHEPDHRGALRPILIRAAEIWQSNIDQVRDYIEARGLDSKSCSMFQLGYSVESLNALSNQLLQEGFKDEFIVLAGLATATSNGLVDRFRGRLMFPICDQMGNVIGFGGRAMKDGIAKYINTSETPVYSKSKALYGLHIARKYIHKSGFAILTEGYMDTIMLHQHEILNAIATCGTALTAEQCTMIRRYTDAVLIARDSDAAGMKASARDIEMLLKAGIYPNVLPFPKGDDPDSFCKRVGREGFVEHIKNNRRDFIPFLIKFYSNEFGSDSLGKSKMIAKVVEVINMIQDRLLRHTSLETLSKAAAIPINLLQSKLSPEQSTNAGNDQHAFTSDPLHSHEAALLALIVNHGLEPCNGSTILSQVLIAMEQIPTVNCSSTFIDCLNALKAGQSLLIGDHAGLIGTLIEIDSKPIEDAPKIIDRLQIDFHSFHLDCLVSECKALIKTSTGEAKETLLAKLQVLLNLKNDLKNR